MIPLPLHEFHHTQGAQFTEVNGAEAVAHYGDWLAEYTALRNTAGVIDLSFRSRLCLTGADRARFLHGQVTNAVKELGAGQGCYAAVTTAKGKMESDLYIYNLPDELLLDFEPGLTAAIQQRLEKFLVADDVQVVDVAPHYGLITVQGPKAEKVIRAIGLFDELPVVPLSFVKISDGMLGEIYLMKQPRLGEAFGMRWEAGRDTGLAGDTPGDPKAPSALRSAGAVQNGFDLFVPTASLGAVADKLIAGARGVGGCACGWRAFETTRLEAGIPRFGADMDETNIPLECGIEGRAVSYKKGCYIGQEVINRIHSIGHVNREFRGLKLADDLVSLPVKGDKLFKDGKEAGYVTSAAFCPVNQANIALGYMRREFFELGTELILESNGKQTQAVIGGIPLGFTSP